MRVRSFRRPVTVRARPWVVIIFFCERRYTASVRPSVFSLPLRDFWPDEVHLEAGAVNHPVLFLDGSKEVSLDAKSATVCLPAPVVISAVEPPVAKEDAEMPHTTPYSIEKNSSSENEGIE